MGHATLFSIFMAKLKIIYTTFQHESESSRTLIITQNDCICVISFFACPLGLAYPA